MTTIKMEFPPFVGQNNEVKVAELSEGKLTL